MAKEDLQAFCEEEPRARGRLIAKGALRLMSAAADLRAAVLATCLLAATFLALVLVPAALALCSSATCHAPRFICAKSNWSPTNVYFVKHEKRIWTEEELCNIETTARRYPDYNIFMIDILKEQSANEVEISEKYFNELVNEYARSGEKYKINLRNANSLESKLRYKLSELSNVRNIDISVKRLFSRSILGARISSLSSEEIELAGRFHVIWESPGMTLEPLEAYQLASFRRFFNGHSADAVASIQIDNDLQAANVPCHSFVGIVEAEIAKSNFTDRQDLLTRAILKFCPSVAKCNGVRIVTPVSGRPQNFTTCPIVRATADLNNNSNRIFNGVIHSNYN